MEDQRGWGPLTATQIAEVYDTLAKHVVPGIDLAFETPFELLVGVLLSAQTTDVAVNAATAELFRKARTPQAIAALGVDGVVPHIKQLGFYNTKAKNLVEMARLLVERHNGEVPRDAAALTELPGIGRKSANVLLNAVWGEPVIGVDTHVQRVANRIGICATKDVAATERVLMARTEPRHLRFADPWLTLFGRHACKAKKPACRACPIAHLCVFPDKTTEGEPGPLTLPRPVRPFPRG